MRRSFIFLYIAAVTLALNLIPIAESAEEVDTTEALARDQNIGETKSRSAPQIVGNAERLELLEKTFGQPYKSWAIYHSSKNKPASPINDMEILFLPEHAGIDVPKNEQWYFYRLCESYFHYRKYDRLDNCLQRLERSLDRYGEEDLDIANWSMISAKATPYTPYPLPVEVRLIRGQVALEFSDPHAALRYFHSANEIWSEKYEVLGKDLEGWKRGNFEYLVRDVQLYRLAFFLAIAKFQAGDVAGSRKFSDAFERSITHVLFGVNKLDHVSNLVFMRMATGQPDKALELINTSDQSNKSGRFFNALFSAFSHPVLNVVWAGYQLMSDPRTVNSKFQIATLLVSLGKYNEAKSGLDELLSDELLQSSSSLYWAALYDRGRIAESEGDIESAISHYQRSIEQIEAQRSTINSEGARIGFFGDRQNPYRALIRLLIQQDKQEDAFLITERSKARALVDLLAKNKDLLDSSGSNQQAEELLAQQRTLDGLMQTGDTPSMKVASKLPLLTSAELGKRDPLAIIKQIRSVQSETVKAIDRVSPELASLVAVTDINLDAIRERMQKDETLVSYFYDQNDMYAFVVTKAQIVVERLDRSGLEKDVDAFRKALQEPGNSYQPIASQLYDRLIRPWIGKVTTNKLIVAPHGALHYLPFNALADESGFLIDRYQLSFLPSASTIRFIGKKKSDSKAGAILALGNPDLGNPHYDLQFAEKEARSVASLFPGSATLLRKEASKENLKKYGAGFKYLHFASHGEFDADNPMGSALMLAGNSITDEKFRLTVSELYSMRLNADLVTLSACQTGLGKVSNGDDVLGLLRGFLYAGANSVISTLWEIDDEATEKLMVGFYRDLKGGKPKAKALRDAQIELRKQYSEPRYWAAFQITGS